MNPLLTTQATSLDFTRAERLILLPFLTLIMFAAIFGNCWILLIIISRKEMRTPYYILVANLVFTDMCISIVDMPLTLIAIVQNGWELGYHACQFHAYSIALFFSMNITTIIAMTAEKYFSLVHPLSRFVTQRRTLSAVAIIWVFAVIFGGLPFLGWGRYMYNKSTFSCGLAYPENREDRLFYLTTILILNVIPIVLMAFSYFRVNQSFRQHSKKMRNFTHGQSTYLNVLRLQKHLVLMNFLTLLIFIACWLPFFLFLMLAIGIRDMYTLPHGIGTAAYIFSYSGSCWNPILYLTMNAKFRYETISLVTAAFKAVCCRSNVLKIWTRKRNDESAIQESYKIKRLR
ncbi:opsin-3-like [Clytia hemisphaerica]|uniref:opsin-3-like n=1 Tax=Clytia hemisphaerica TaxID=252671 RepID=UPI0034D65B0E